MKSRVGVHCPASAPVINLFSVSSRQVRVQEREEVRSAGAGPSLHAEAALAAEGHV